jgi:hypothetical protein
MDVAVCRRSGVSCKEEGRQASTVTLVYLLCVANATMGTAMGPQENKAENLQ